MERDEGSRNPPPKGIGTMSTDNGVPEKSDGTTTTDLHPDDLDDISGGAGPNPHQPGGESYGGYDPE
jgi:hypothetical protein